MRTLSLVLFAALTLTACKKEELKAVEPPKPAAPPPVAEVKPAPAPAPTGAARVIELKVTENGFEPGSVKLKKDEPVKFIVTRITDATCATELLIAETDIKADLPLNKPVEIAWTPTKAGQVKFGCAMDMMVSGLLLVE